MNNIDNLTIVVVTYRTDENVLIECLNSIDSKVKILLVENSKNDAFKKKFEIMYPNLNVILSGSNLGYGAGNNFGLSEVITKYALILSPDVILEKNFFNEINYYLGQQINFHIMGVSYKKETEWKTSGVFKKLKLKKKIDEEKKNHNDSLEEVDWVVGCTMLVNLEKFETRKLFDENIFLYFEEFDLCRRVRIIQGKVYSSKKLFVKHLGKKGSADSNSKYSLEFEKLRNWHWMWSKFYYYKKHFSYFYAVNKTFGKLIRSIFNIFLSMILFDKKQRAICSARVFGTINAMLGRKSWYRVKSSFNDQES